MIEKIPPSIEELEENDQLDMADLQRLIMKDREMEASNNSGGGNRRKFNGD